MLKINTNNNTNTELKLKPTFLRQEPSTGLFDKYQLRV